MLPSDYYKSKENNPHVLFKFNSPSLFLFFSSCWNIFSSFSNKYLYWTKIITILNRRKRKVVLKEGRIRDAKRGFEDRTICVGFVFYFFTTPFHWGIRLPWESPFNTFNILTTSSFSSWIFLPFYHIISTVMFNSLLMTPFFSSVN